MTFSGRLPLLEVNPRWKTTFGGKMTFGRKWPLVEDELRWKTTLNGRRPLVEDNHRWKMTFVGSLHAAYSALWHFFDNQSQHFGGGFSVGFENVGVKISYTKFRGGGVTSLRGMLLRLSMNPLLVIFYTFLCVKLLKERINIFKHLLNKWTILWIDSFY